MQCLRAWEVWRSRSFSNRLLLLREMLQIFGFLSVICSLFTRRIHDLCCNYPIFGRLILMIAPLVRSLCAWSVPLRNILSLVPSFLIPIPSRSFFSSIEPCQFDRSTSSQVWFCFLRIVITITIIIIIIIVLHPRRPVLLHSLSFASAFIATLQINCASLSLYSSTCRKADNYNLRKLSVPRFKVHRRPIYAFLCTDRVCCSPLRIDLISLFVSLPHLRFDHKSTFTRPSGTFCHP